MSKFVMGYGVGTTLQGLATYSEVVITLGLFTFVCGLVGAWVDYKIAQTEK